MVIRIKKKSYFDTAFCIRWPESIQLKGCIIDRCNNKVEVLPCVLERLQCGFIAACLVIRYNGLLVACKPIITLKEFKISLAFLKCRLRCMCTAVCFYTFSPLLRKGWWWGEGTGEYTSNDKGYFNFIKLSGQ